MSRVGYFKGTYNCGGKTLTMYIFSEGSSGSDLQYISYEDTNGKLVRVKMALGDTATQKESLTVNQPTIPLGGTITSLPGATKFRYQFTSPAACVLEFAIEPSKAKLLITPDFLISRSVAQRVRVSLLM